jgi:epoxyqueuosine reductase
MSLDEELKEMLTAGGASMVGFADMSPFNLILPFGVSVAVALPPGIVRSICGGPNIDYYNAYNSINEKLDSLVLSAERFLVDKGYNAHAQARSRVRDFGVSRTLLPHKTAATRAGLGWIGKCALLVTEEYGSAVRISSLLTDAGLPCAEPVTVSKCGDCTVCTDNCPGKAVSGRLWHAGYDRDLFFDAQSCRSKARELSLKNMNLEVTLCGKCIESCPYTQRYLRSR